MDLLERVLSVRPRFDKWVGDGGGEENDEGFTGVVHDMRISDREIIIDLGSAQIVAFTELIDILTVGGAPEITVRTVRD